VIQKGRRLDGAVPIVMTTHESREKNVRNALRRSTGYDVVRDKSGL